MTDRYDRLFSSLWKQHDGKLEMVEKSLHKIILSDLTDKNITLELDKELIEYLWTFKKFNKKNNLVFIWTARDKTVHEHFVREILQQNGLSFLFDGLIFARGNAKRKCDVIEAFLDYNPNHLIVIDDKIENLAQAEKVIELYYNNNANINTKKTITQKRKRTNYDLYLSIGHTDKGQVKGGTTVKKSCSMYTSTTTVLINQAKNLKRNKPEKAPPSKYCRTPPSYSPPYIQPTSYLDTMSHKICHRRYEVAV
eukprot:UN25767